MSHVSFLTTSNSPCDMMNYLDLAIMTEHLISETYDAAIDFQRKVEFHDKRENDLLKNDEILTLLKVKVNEFIGIMNNIEAEIKWLDAVSLECRRKMQSFDVNYIDPLYDGLPYAKFQAHQQQGNPNFCKTQREIWLESLERTGYVLRQLEGLKRDREELNYHCQRNAKYALKIITDIMDCHSRILENTEQSIQLILDKIAFISKHLNMLQNRCYNMTSLC